MAEPYDRGLCLLSLDGGGIRGISELIILHGIMLRIQHTERSSELPRPYRYFNLIGGISTGGLIALMLGRLKMSTEEAIEAYNELSELEQAIKKIVEKYMRLNVPEEIVLDMEDNACKAFVCATPATNIQGFPTLFRTYTVPQDSVPDSCTIWQAGRATTATPTFFKQINIGNPGTEIAYIDAALGYNNPVREVVKEVEVAYSPNSKIACIVSVGTGYPKPVYLHRPNFKQKILPTKAIDALARIVTNANRVSEEMEREYCETPDIYFRFNIEQGLQNITLEEWEKLGEVKECTTQYLNTVKVSRSIDKLVNILARRNTPSEPAPILSTVIANSNDSSPNNQRDDSHDSAATKSPTTKNKHWVIPHSKSPVFTERRDILSQIERFIPSCGTKDAGSRRVFVLHGLGGSGVYLSDIQSGGIREMLMYTQNTNYLSLRKTQMVLHFCEKNRDR
ncbi:acyl transferase/acyl hydrolase/lysophospholipase [Pyronema domesticum]|nr:acyl transferase/acyl hydrolase/lysophospholipase [Pyronema domesticum]